MYELLVALSLLRPPAPCDPKNYALVYAAIVQEALKRPDTCIPIDIEYRSSKGDLLFIEPGCKNDADEVGELRNKSIRILRKICNGQLSIYEK